MTLSATIYWASEDSDAYLDEQADIGELELLATQEVTLSPSSAVKPKPRRRLLLVAAAVAILLIVAFGVPWIQHSLRTVSTDDAYPAFIVGD